MQGKNIEKYAPIKRRLHKYIKHNGLPLKEILSQAGVRDNLFNGKNMDSEIGGHMLSKIVAVLPEISTHWLLTGIGDMEISTPTPSRSIIKGDKNVSMINNGGIYHEIRVPTKDTEESSLINSLLVQIAEKDRQIAEKDRQIADLLGIIKSHR